MDNYIVIGILILIIGATVFYLVRQKKNGVKCVGCPHAKQCGGKYGNCDYEKSVNNARFMFNNEMEIT